MMVNPPPPTQHRPGIGDTTVPRMAVDGFLDEGLSVVIRRVFSREALRDSLGRIEGRGRRLPRRTARCCRDRGVRVRAGANAGSPRRRRSTRRRNCPRRALRDAVIAATGNDVTLLADDRAVNAATETTVAVPAAGPGAAVMAAASAFEPGDERGIALGGVRDPLASGRGPRATARTTKGRLLYTGRAFCRGRRRWRNNLNGQRNTLSGFPVATFTQKRSPPVAADSIS